MPGTGPRAADAKALSAGQRKLNNLVAVLLEAKTISRPGVSLTFSRPTAGWIFVSAACQGQGSVTVTLDEPNGAIQLIAHDKDGAPVDEAMRHVTAGEHQLRVDCDGGITVENLVVRAIPELMHCGLGFDPAIQILRQV